MSQAFKLLIALCPLLPLVAYDEGRLIEDYIETTQEGGNARLSATISGFESWPSSYTLALAGFEDGNEYAIVSKNIDGSINDGQCDIVLTGIPAEVTTIELCAIDRLRRRVTSFVSVDYTASISSDTILVPSSSINLSMAAAIQRDIFNTTCIQCHGGSSYSAAGLNLTEGNSWTEMISVQSVKEPDMMRIKPGESASSILYLILAGDLSSSWHYDHSVEVVKQEKLELIHDWIDAGANPQ